MALHDHRRVESQVQMDDDASSLADVKFLHSAAVMSNTSKLAVAHNDTLLNDRKPVLILCIKLS